MHNNQIPSDNSTGLTLVTGATGKTGSRIVSSLRQKNVPVRIASRSASPPVYWNNEAGWDAWLQNVHAIYISYAPDLALPGATDTIQAFVNRAVRLGAKRLVLLSGRGEAEAQACEQIVQKSGIEWTIVRASWFFQNFSEGAFVDMIQSGQITLPAGDTPEPFIDVDDIVEVAVAALTEPGHAGEVYEVTGPRMLTFAGIASELSDAIGRKIHYVQIPHQTFVEAVKDSGAPREVVWIMDYLFSTVLDGRNAYLADGIQRALRRPPTDFTDYVRNIATTGLWKMGGA